MQRNKRLCWLSSVGVILWLGILCSAVTGNNRETVVEETTVEPTAAVSQQGQLPVVGPVVDRLIDPDAGTYPQRGLFRPDDEIWYLNARNLACGSEPGDLSKIHASLLQPRNGLFASDCLQNGWRDAGLNELLLSHQQSPDRITVIYVHGDRTDEGHCLLRGVQFYQNVFMPNAVDRPAIRFVIWAWRADREVLRPTKDYRRKAERSRIIGKAMAQFVRQFSDDRLVLAGYSLGCQVFLEAFHELAQDRPLPESRPVSRYQLALIAPALEGNFVACQQSCSAVPPASRLQRIDIFDNSQDPALKVARFNGRRTAPGGNAGIRELALRGNLPSEEIRYFDLASFVGNHHSIVRYSQTDVLRAQIINMLWQVP